MGQTETKRQKEIEESHQLLDIMGVESEWDGKELSIPQRLNVLMGKLMSMEGKMGEISKQMQALDTRQGAALNRLMEVLEDATESPE